MVTKNSFGYNISLDVDDIKNFWNWFGNSVTINKDGAPMVLYHGTEKSFDEFNDIKAFESSSTNNNGKAFFATNMVDCAESYCIYYAGEYREHDLLPDGGNIMPVYFKMLNPLIIQCDCKFFNDSFNGRSMSEIITFAKIESYDGVIFENIHDFGSIRSDRHYRYDNSSGFSLKGYNSYAVFNPNQIKSAIGNTGEFSNSNCILG